MIASPRPGLPSVLRHQGNVAEHECADARREAVEEVLHRAAARRGPEHAHVEHGVTKAKRLSAGSTRGSPDDPTEHKPGDTRPYVIRLRVSKTKADCGGLAWPCVACLGPSKPLNRRAFVTKGVPRRQVVPLRPSDFESRTPRH